MGIFTVKQLIKELKKCPQDALVFGADHDHGTYETAGTIGQVYVVNQQEAKEKGISDALSLEDIFEIDGTYVCLRP